MPRDGILLVLGGGFAGGDVTETLGGDGFADFVGGFVGLIVGGRGLVVVNVGDDDCFLGAHEDGFLFAFGVGLVGGDICLGVILGGDGFVDCGGSFVAVILGGDSSVDCGDGFMTVTLNGDGLDCGVGFVAVILGDDGSVDDLADVALGGCRTVDVILDGYDFVDMDE